MNHDASSGEHFTKRELGTASPPPHYGVATQAGVVKAEGESQHLTIIYLNPS